MPEESGFDFWNEKLDTHALTRGELLAFFGESTENQAQVIGSISNGFEFKLYG